MKFNFSFEPVLKVRKHQEKLQKQKLAKELSKKNEIDELRTDIQERLKNYLDNAQSGQAENLHVIKRRNRQMVQVHQVINKLNEDLDNAENIVNKERQKLATAYKKRHILEKMKEKEKQRFLEKMLKLEQKEMDEIATQTYSR